MRFEYSPANPDDWPDVINVTVSGVDGEHGFEDGDVRAYEPNWKHRVAGSTIREQREKIASLEHQLAEASEWPSAPLKVTRHPDFTESLNCGHCGHFLGVDVFLGNFCPNCGWHVDKEDAGNEMEH